MFAALFGGPFRWNSPPKKTNEDLFSGFGARRKPATGSVNAHDAAAPLSDLSALSALWADFDLNSPETADAAHRLLQTLAPTLFPPQFFSGVDADGLARALATLMLAQHVGPQHGATQRIAPAPDDARTTLTQRLSPAGQAALQQSLGNSHADNEFSEYLAPADRYCVAGNLSLQHAATYLKADGLVKTPEDASEHALEAVDLYTRAGHPRGAAGPKAAQAYERAAKLMAEAHQHGKAGHAYERAAHAYQALQQPERAADAYLRAAQAYATLALPEPAAHAKLRADALLGVADARTRPGQTDLAIKAYRRAAKAYAVGHRPSLAGTGGP